MIKIFVSDSSGETLNGVKLTVIMSTRDIIKLNMKPLDKFNNAVGPITVAYAGGTLMGEGGPVEPFEETFIPTDLIAKPNQHVREHISIRDVTVNSVLTKINFIENKTANEHISISNVTVNSVLTHIDDI